jgi:hypothetical protein
MKMLPGVRRTELDLDESLETSALHIADHLLQHATKRSLSHNKQVTHCDSLPRQTNACSCARIRKLGHATTVRVVGRCNHPSLLRPNIPLLLARLHRLHPRRMHSVIASSWKAL